MDIKERLECIWSYVENMKSGDVLTSTMVHELQVHTWETICTLDKQQLKNECKCKGKDSTKKSCCTKPISDNELINLKD